MLLKIEKEKSYSNIAIAGALKNSNLQNADKALFTSLVYGVLERKITLDYNLSLYLKQPIKKLKPAVATILRLGAYQVLFLERIPDRAAINESVELSKKNGCAFASGLINAVLRKVSSEGLKLPDIDKVGLLEFLSIKYSCPVYLVELFVDAYGKDCAEGILEHSLKVPPVTIRVNTTKTTTDELEDRLTSKGIEVSRHPKLKDALCLNGSGDITALLEFEEGLFHVQDASSQMCCEALGVKPGDTVFDVCAAPGGKSFTLAELMENKGTIKAFDLYEHRVKLISSGAKRLGLQIIDANLGNAEEYNESLGFADKVLCDAPCAGLGIIGRKPEIRYKTAENIDIFPSLQYYILNIASMYLRAGGTLVYSTCSLNPKENEEVVSRFISEHEGFDLKTQKTILPQEYDCDGFFYAVIERRL